MDIYEIANTFLQGTSMPSAMDLIGSARHWFSVLELCRKALKSDEKPVGSDFPKKKR